MAEMVHQSIIMHQQLEADFILRMQPTKTFEPKDILVYQRI